MTKMEMRPISEADEDEDPKYATRVVIQRDNCGRSRADQGDHLFLMYGYHPRYNFTDSGAEDPLEPVLDADGDETGKVKVRDGLYAFDVNLYDHSGLSFSLGGDPACGFDPGGWDTTHRAAVLYTDRDRFVQHMGEGRWMQVPTDPGDWGKPWRPAEDEDEFVLLTLEPVAEGEVQEMNLLEQGSVYGYVVQRRVSWDGKAEDGSGLSYAKVTWEDTDDSEWGCLTEHADDIDFPRDPDVPVFYEDDVYLHMDKERGLGSYEYTIPDFVVRRLGWKAGQTLYLAGSVENPRWVEDPAEALTYHSWWKVQQAAQSVVSKEEYSAYKTCVERDKLKEVA